MARVPPKGTSHSYLFTLNALDTKLTAADNNPKTVLNALKGHVLAKAELTAVYSRC